MTSAIPPAMPPLQSLIQQARQSSLSPTLTKQITDHLVVLESPEEFEAALQNLSACIDLNDLVDIHGWTLAHHLADYSRQGHIPWKWPLLASCGVELNTRAIDPFANDGGSGLYPLHLVAVVGSEQDLQTLLSFGAEINCLTHNQENALFYAHPAMAQALIKAGVEIEHQNSQGLTPLSQACHVATEDNGLLELAKMLIEHGADLENSSSLYPPGPAAAALLRAARHARALEKEAHAPPSPRSRI